MQRQLLLIILLLSTYFTYAQINSYTISSTTGTICAGSNADVTLSGSQNGINYYLYDVSNNLLSGPVAGNGSPLTLNTGPLPATTDVYVEAEDPNHALNFDGNNDYVDLGNLSTPIINGDFTVECYTRIESAPTYRGLITAFNSSSGGWAIMQDGNKMKFLYGTSASSSSSDEVISTSLILNQWYHVAIVKEGNTMKMYIDGVLQGTQSTFFTAPDQPVFVGRRYTNLTNGWFHDGDIDELRIWNDARTTAEIQNNMGNCLNGTEPNLVAYYDFEDSYGSSTLTDKTPNNNNGILQNMNINQDWVTSLNHCPTTSATMTGTATVTVQTSGGCAGQPYLFTHAGATYGTGPTQAELDAEYGTGHNLHNQVTSNNGIQEWTVPYTGTYKVRAIGGKGGNSSQRNGGSPASIEGEFFFTAGTDLSIIVGQAGVNGYNTTGGGGGSFVWETAQGQNGLLLAAGGGGAGYWYTGHDAQTGQQGTGNVPVAVGQGGNYDHGSGGAGAGWLSDGSTTVQGGKRPLNGGEGGAHPSSLNPLGGFGGGGYGRTWWGGGAGGYTGGGRTVEAGGGGGSYNAGSNQNNSLASTATNGTVYFEFIPPSLSWTGAVNNNWNNTGNWSCNCIPGASDNIYIDGNITNQPEIGGGGFAFFQVKNITLVNNPVINISNPAATLEIGGDLAGATTINGSGTLSFSSGSHDITQPVNVSGILSVPTAAVLNTNNNLTLDDGAVLLHGAGTPNGGGTVNGNITVKRQGNSQNNVYNYWGSPVKNTNVSVLGSHLHYYDITAATGISTVAQQNGWQPATGMVMQNGVGYISTNAGMVNFNGEANGNQPNQGEITVNVTRTASPNLGWNLVANPYPSGLSAQEFLTQNSGTLEGTVYFWDDDGSGGSGWSPADYATWNLAGSVGNATNSITPDGNIGAAQGFFVEASNIGTNSITFNNTMRVGDNDQFFKQQPISRLWVSLQNGQGLYNETLVAFSDNATDNEDWGYDAKKLQGNPNIALYTKLNGGNYAIQTLASLQQEKTVALGVKTGMSGTYTLQLERFEHLPASMVVYLEDTQEGSMQNLRVDNSYTFTSNGTTIEGRFLLHFFPPVEVAAYDESCAENDGHIELSYNSSNTWNYTLADAMGNTVANGHNWSGTATITDLQGGTYTLTLDHGDGYVVTETLEVDDKQAVTATLAANNYSPLVGEPVQFTSILSGADHFNWQFGDGTSTNQFTAPVHTFYTAGTFEVVLTASNEDCEASYSKTISVQDDITAIEEADAEDIHIFALRKQIIIEQQGGYNRTANISLFDLSGKQLLNMEAELAPGQPLKLATGQPNGNYIVRVQTANNVYTRQVSLMDINR